MGLETLAHIMFQLILYLKNRLFRFIIEKRKSRVQQKLPFYIINLNYIILYKLE